MLNEITIGQKISEIRKLNNETQSALADLLGISAQAVSKWESGESMPDIITLSRIATHFDVDLNYFAEVGTAMMSDAELDNDAGDKGKDKDSDDGDYENINALKRAAHLSRHSNHHHGHKKVHDGSSNSDSNSDTNSGYKWDMGFTTWKNTDFSGIKNNHGGSFSASNIVNCRFVDADLEGANFSANNIKASIFDSANLTKVKFIASNLTKSSFVDAKMDSVIVRASNISDNNFDKAIWDNLSIKASKVANCEMNGTRLDGVEIKSSKLKGCTITANISNSSFYNTMFKEVVFDNCELTNTFFKHCRFAKSEFVNCRADAPTYAFLQNCNIDMSGITKI